MSKNMNKILRVSDAKEQLSVFVRKDWESTYNILNKRFKMNQILLTNPKINKILERNGH